MYIRGKLVIRDLRHGLYDVRERRKLHGLSWYRDVRAAMPRAQDALRADYDDYVANVSWSGMAVSLPTAALLRCLCEHLRPRTILDLGSGFSSAVLRQYAQGAGNATVISVDDDAAWLGRTREYLERRGLPADRLFTWPDFRAEPLQLFDFVFHDLGSVDTRRATLAAALDYVAPGGAAILDDLHKHRIESVARPIASAAGFKLVWVRELTLDEYGRFATWAQRAPGGSSPVTGRANPG